METKTASEWKIRLAILIRRIGVTGVAGVVTGLLVGGIGGRIAMRISALAAPERFGSLTENGNVVGEVTAAGSVGLVFFIGILTGGVGAVMYLIAERWLLWAGRWSGLAFGVLLLAAGGAASSTLDPDNFDFVVLGHPVLNVGMFVGLFLLFGVTIVWLTGVMDRWLPTTKGMGTLATLGYSLLILPGGMFVLGLALLLLDAEACGCEPSPVVAAAVFLLAATTVVSWAYAVLARPEPGWVPAAGFIALAVAVISGGLRVFRDIGAIIVIAS